MAEREGSLIQSIEDDIVSKAPLADALRKCVLLGGKAGSAELREWATRELRGYDGVADLPKYRTIGAPILYNATVGNAILTGHLIEPTSLPEYAREHISNDVEMRHGVGELEALVEMALSSKGKSVHLPIPGSTVIARTIDQRSGNPYQHISDIYWSVSAAALAGVVDQVRTTLAEIMGEVIAGMPADASVPSAELTDQALHIAVSGNKSRVTVTSASADRGATATVTGTVEADEESKFWTRSRRIGALVVGVSTIIAAVPIVRAWFF